MSLSVKVFYISLGKDGSQNREVRRFSVNQDVATTFDYMRKKILQAFPGLINKSFSLQWKGVTTRQAKENFRSLRSKRLLDSGWIQRILHHKIESTGAILLKAEVTRSYQTSKDAHEPWVALTEAGEIITAQCTCKCGPGESCSHVGGLFRKIEKTCSLGLTKPETCTDVRCKWNSVEWGGVQPAPIAEINLYSEEAKQALTDTTNKTVVRASQSQREALTRKLLMAKTLPVGLSLFRSTASNFVSKRPVPVITRLPKMLKQLLPNPAACTSEQIKMVEENSHPQALSLVWHEQRAGRVTSSNVHGILHTKMDKPSATVILSSTVIVTREINSDALRWGRNHEKDAIQHYIDSMQDHVNFEYKRSGLHIHPQDQVLAASPDGLVSCDCCGLGTVEVKCPYKLRDSPSFEDWSSSDVYSFDAHRKLRQDHEHWYQVQHHMYCTGRQYCDYVVWTNVDCAILRVDVDPSYASQTVPYLKTFWERNIQKELMDGQLEMARAAKKAADKRMEIYCFCRQPQDDRGMVGCDNNKCKYKWFHFDCVGLRMKPKGNVWYCRECAPQCTPKRRSTRGNPTNVKRQKH